VVARTLAWLSKCRGILIRWEKPVENYLGLLKLACVLLWFRRYHCLTNATG
jgi:putative transposase